MYAIEGALGSIWCRHPGLDLGVVCRRVWEDRWHGFVGQRTK